MSLHSFAVSSEFSVLSSEIELELELKRKLKLKSKLESELELKGVHLSHSWPSQTALGASANSTGQTIIVAAEEEEELTFELWELLQKQIIN